MKILFVRRSCLIILSFLAFSCSHKDSRLSECRQFITIKQDTDKQAIELSDDLQTKNKQKILEVATIFDDAASKFAAIETEDEKLLELQAGFVQFYQEQAEATRDYVTAFKAIDAQKAEFNVQKIEQLDFIELQLVEEINNYCQPKSNS